MSLENPATTSAAPSQRARAVAILAVAFVCAVLLILSEVVARRLVTLPLERPAPQVRYDPHPTRLFTLRPNQRAFSFGGTVTVGEAGLRQHPSAISDTTKATTVIALGDSFTFGMGVDDSATFPARLEQGLRARVGAVRVINAGVSSYQVKQELDLIREKALDGRVNAVVHGLYWNDYLVNDHSSQSALRVLREDGLFVWDDAESSRGNSNIVVRIARRSALLFVARRAALTVRSAFGGERAGEMEYDRVERLLGTGVIDTAGFARVPRFYGELQQLAEEHGFALYVVIMPVEVVVRGTAPGSHPYPRHARAILDSLGIQYFDAHTLWESRGLGAELFLPYNKHPSAEAYAVLGDAVAAWLSERPEWPRP